MNGKLVLIGGGGHCKSVLSAIDKTKYSDIIITDIPEKVGTAIDGVKIAGTDADLPDFFKAGYIEAFITVGTVKAGMLREKIYESIKNIGFTFPSIIDASAVIADSAIIEEGVFIGKNAVVNAGTNIGRFSIVNTGAIVDHDCMIGNFVHLSPGITLSGMVNIGNYSHVGTGSSVKQCVTIGDCTTIGMGSVVLHDIPSNCTAFGVPCKIREGK